MSGAGGDSSRPHPFRESVRTLLTSLILAGIIGLVGMVFMLGDKQAKADADRAQADKDRAVQIATLQTQVTEVQRALASLIDLSARMTRVETTQGELLRRQLADEQWREHLSDRDGRRGTR